MVDCLSPSTLVKFHVSHRIHAASCQLFERHPSSKLTLLVSENLDRDIIYIDRDGDIFAQVLNYLRYKVVHLMTMQTKMFIQDMDFYGIVPVDGTFKFM